MYEIDMCSIATRKTFQFLKRWTRLLKMDIHMSEGDFLKEGADSSPERSLRAAKKALRSAPVEECSREELLTKVRQLEAHVTQLKNIIAKAEAKPGSQLKHMRPFDFTRFNKRHIALKILYLGWDYNGFTVQEDTDKTIEAELFDALIRAKLIEERETSNYHRCGRTDKGVSAFSQVITIDVRTNLLEGIGVITREDGAANSTPDINKEEIEYVKILNRLLPAEIRVLAWAPVSTDFSARFSCQQRTYKYFFPKGTLNIELMLTAAKKLIGVKDFRNFCKMDVAHGVVSFVRNISAVEITECNHRENPMYTMCEMTVVGKAFLWHQIRSIVTILFLVGKEVELPEIIDELLDVEKHPKKPQYPLASEIPLVLFDCQFENLDWIYHKESHCYDIKTLQELWSRSAIRAAMIRRMLTELENVPIEKSEQELSDSIVDWMVRGWRGKTYKRLLERPKGDSLEQKMEAVAKRKKIFLEGTNPS